MEIINIQEFHDRVQNLGDNDYILDVRSPEEFSEGHIENAHNTPHEEVGPLVEELEPYDHVYVHCKMGGRAKIASKILINGGLNNVICVGDGGMQAWMENGWPVER